MTRGAAFIALIAGAVLMALSQTSEASQPGFDFIVCHYVGSREQTLLRKKYDPPMQAGAALE